MTSVCVSADTLTKADRCDRCGAAASIRAHRGDRGDLLFCQHHYNRHGEALSHQRFVCFAADGQPL